MLGKNLKEILRETNVGDVIQDLEKIIESLVEEYKPISIILTGSLARGRFVRGLSDIDILVITEHSVPDDKRFLLRAVKDIDVEVTVISLEELLSTIRNGNQFYVDAVMYGIEVYGDLLERLTG